MPGFRIVDYTFTRADGALTVTPTVPMRLCPQITRDLATPFISKDGRYVVAHDDSKPGLPASLKIFEILAPIRRRRRPPAPSAWTSALPPARPTSASTAAARLPHQQARLPHAVRERRPQGAGHHRRGRRRPDARRARRDHRRRRHVAAHDVDDGRRRPLLPGVPARRQGVLRRRMPWRRTARSRSASS